MNTEIEHRATIFKKLKKLFSNDVIIRNVGGKKLKLIDTDMAQMGTDRNSLRDRFNRLRSSTYNLHNRDMSMSYQSARLELFRDYDCIGEDTIIPLPDGSQPTIKELTEKYKDSPQKRFHVFSYDHESDSIKLGNAYHPRKKGVRKCWKVTFDNDQSIIGSAGHPFLMRNGEYKKLQDIVVGESVMPFYRSEYGYKNHGFKRYKQLYNFSKGWQKEHRIIAEQFHGDIGGKVIHHKNFVGSDNSPDNLIPMEYKDHYKLHSTHSKNVLWGEENYDNQLNKLKSHPNYINRKINKWNGRRSGKNNPFYGKSHTFESNEKRSDSLKLAFVDRDISNTNNPNYRNDLTIEKIEEKSYELFKNTGKLKIWDLVDYIGCDYSVIQNRLKSENINWKEFKSGIEQTLNHKIKSIEYVGEADVYDVTVEHFQNFATDSVFIHNTMDMDPILSSALDIYADECLTKSELGKVLTVSSDDENIKKILENLFYDILNVEFNLWSWTRNMVKYGDFFLLMEISPEYGVYNVHPLSAYEVTRVEGTDENNRAYTKFQHDGSRGGQEYENFEVAHFRLLSDSNFLPYGKSMLEGARRVWKQLSLMEDAMLIHRIMRAPEKRIFKIDVGNIAPSEVDGHMEKLISRMKKVPYIDERTGDYNLKFNLMNMVEDFYLPVRGGDSGTSIDTLSGMEFTGTEDIEYLRNKLMSALKIPKAFLGYDETLSGKSTLAQEDVRFSKTINRIQRIIISELNKIAIVHLRVQGFEDASLVNFKLELTNPSSVLEQEKIAIWGDKMNLAKDMTESKLFSSTFVYKELFSLSDTQIEEIRNGVVNDQKILYRLKQIEDAGNDPAKSKQSVDDGGSPSDMPDDSDMGGGMDDELPDLSAEEPERLQEYRGESDRKGESDQSNKSREFPFGENPLGKKEKTGSKSDGPLRDKVRGGLNGVPSLRETETTGLESMFTAADLKKMREKLSGNKKEVITERNSMLDEKNILPD